MTRSLTDRLAQLRTRLARLRTAHMVLGAGCACGLPAGHIDASAMDAMIGGYLADKYQAAGRDRLARLLDRARHPDGLAAVLTELIDGAAAATDDDAAVLCDDLEVSIESLEDATGGRRRAGRPRIESL
jgi:hypothetical protein